MVARAGMHAVKAHSPGWFALFRIGFGAWLAWQFAALAPWASELFVRGGSAAGPGAGLGLCVAGATLGALLAAGWRRVWVAPALWLTWAVLHNLNPLIITPATAYVGLLLLLLALVPDGEPLRWRGRKIAPTDWAMPAGVFWGAWFLMAANYSCIGFAKLLSPSWLDGTAFARVLHDPIARPGVTRDLALALPGWAQTAFTWATVAGQAAFLPLCLTSRGRVVAWCAMVGMHLGLWTLMNFGELTAGMLWLHAFTFDPEWLPPRARVGRQPVLLYDGECGLCNATVRFLLREDAGGVLRFAPLQGKFGQAALRRLGLPTADFDSIVFLPDADGDVRRLRTAGVLDTLGTLGGVWRVAAVAGCVVPAPIRDAGYRIVARLRYRLFGEYKPTPLPDAAWAARFLD